MKHSRSLDGVRGLAIIWVLSYHCFWLPPKAALLANIPLLPRLASFGWAGVQLFFLLSGYLIAKGLIRSNQEAYGLGQFWCRRLFRIVPPYALLLVTYFVARAAMASFPGVNKQWFSASIPWWSYLLFIQNLYMASAGNLGGAWLCVTWSLAVEMQFYLFISLFLRIISIRKFRSWVLFLILCSTLFRYFIFFLQRSPQTALVVLLPSDLNGFLFGAFLASLDDDSQRPRCFARCAGLLGLLIVAFSVAFVLMLGSGGFGRASLVGAPLCDSVISLGCLGLLILATETSLTWPKRIFEFEPLVVSGHLSYFLYLFHLPVSIFLFSTILGQEPNLVSVPALSVMLLTLVVVYGLATLSLIYLERPLIAFSKTCFQRPAMAASTAAPSVATRRSSGKPDGVSNP
ncbi:MAG: acyltransferase [Opitutaceae bacterium]|jgi:peptidoglycan/LPS O-acetylase OafA/YrhL